MSLKYFQDKKIKKSHSAYNIVASYWFCLSSKPWHTTLARHLPFLQSAVDYHASLKEFYYLFLFNQVIFTNADFAKETDIVYKGVY